MDKDFDNETWIVEVGGDVVKKKSLSGSVDLPDLEQLIYCLWVADYGMRNAGDLETARDLHSQFQSEAALLARELGLPFTQESFSLQERLLQTQYFERFNRICQEIQAIYIN